MNRWPAIVGTLALGILTAGCVTTSGGSPGPVLEEYAGEYTRGPEGSWFHPCSAPAGDRLWVTFMGLGAEEARRLAASGLLVEVPTFVRWRAERAPDGRVGPGGPALLVYEILDARPADQGDCRREGSPVRPGS